MLLVTDFTKSIVSGYNPVGIREKLLGCAVTTGPNTASTRSARREQRGLMTIARISPNLGSPTGLDDLKDPR